MIMNGGTLALALLFRVSAKAKYSASNLKAAPSVTTHTDALALIDFYFFVPMGQQRISKVNPCKFCVTTCWTTLLSARFRFSRKYYSLEL